MTITLTRRGVEIPFGGISNVELGKLKNRLSVESKGFQNQITRTPTFQIYKTERRIVLSRMAGMIQMAKFGHTVDVQITPGEAIDIGETRLPPLMDYQVPIFDRLTTVAFSDMAVRMGVSSAYLDLQAGKGKSYIAMHLVQHFKTKTLVVVPGKDLVGQWLKLLVPMFPGLTIGSQYSDATIDGDIVVATIDTVARSDDFVFRPAGEPRGKKQTLSAAEWFARFGFTVYDELHKYCTAKRRLAFHGASSLYTLGISGTTDKRLDKMDPVAYNYIGRPINGARMMEAVLAANETPRPDWQFSAICLKYNGPEEWTQPMTSTVDTVSHPKMITQFSKDPYRNQLLINKIVGMYREGRKQFVLMDRVELISLFYKCLQRKLGRDAVAAPEIAAPEVDFGEAAIITGDTPADERPLAEQKKIVIGSYACLGTGISWDEFSGIVFGHSRRNGFEQFLFRIFREGGDRSVMRRAYFLQDNATSLKSQYSGFRKVCIDKLKTHPVVEEWDYTEITVDPEVQELSDQYAAWDAANL